MKRIVALFLMVCMMINIVPSVASAAEIEGNVIEDSGIFENNIPNCNHEHDMACGYIKPATETHCSHQYKTACYSEIVHCIHSHDMNFGFELQDVPDGSEEPPSDPALRFSDCLCMVAGE